MAEKSKAELEQELANAQAQIENLRAKVQKLHAEREGWLVTTPNPLYDGKMFGIQFINGQAFIPKDKVVEHFNYKPPKATQLAIYSKEEQAAIRERERISSAERCVQALQSDFGYEVTYFGSDKLDEMQASIDTRQTERMKAENALRTIEAQKELVPPGYMGK